MTATTTTIPDTELRERVISVGDVRLHAVEAGPQDGPLAVLLHGFPEFWYAWRKQIGPLAAAGYRVLAPDQRGYNLSDKPRGVAAYGLDRLADDVLGLLDEAGRERAILVGHDWGGLVAWWTAIRHAERCSHLAVLNMPHPRVMERFLLRDRAQRRRSSYIFQFQLPWLPERRLAAGNFARAAAALAKTSRPGTFSDEDLARYRAAWSQPGAMHAMIQWYRAAFRARPRRPPTTRVRVPALLVWGAGDRFLGREMAAPSLARCERGRLVVVDEATHWVQHEEPERVNRLLLEFFREG
ncbi:MAG TPA: alpha/beta hydrolase [Thermoanaerobaculia bacterium]